jgi:hypothetical protein
MTTYYIDSISGTDTNDGLSETTPWRTVPVQSGYGLGNTWLLKRGSVFPPIDAIFTGNAANESQRVVYGAYGSLTAPPPKIDATGVAYGMRVQNKDYVTVQDIDFYNSTNGGLVIYNNITRACNYFRATRVRAYNNAVDGIGMTHGINAGGVTSSPAIGVIFDSCEGHNNGQHGVAIVAHATGAVLKNCYSTNNSLTSSGWGVYQGGLSVTYLGAIGWTIVGNVKSRSSAMGIEPHSVCSGNTVGGKFFLTKNVGTPTTPGTGEWGYSAGTIYVNIGTIASGYAIAVTFLPNTNATIQDSRGDNHSYFDAVGVGLDRGVFGGTLKRCVGDNNLGSAIQVNQATDITVVGCFGKNNRECVLLSTSAGINNIYNCTSIDNTYGVRVERVDTGTTVNVKNNLLLSPTAIYAATNNGTITNNNNAYTGALDGVSAGGADVTTNLTYTNQYLPKTNSGLVHTGVSFLPVVDLNNSTYYNPPSIGAYEYIDVRGVR